MIERLADGGELERIQEIRDYFKSYFTSACTSQVRIYKPGAPWTDANPVPTHGADGSTQCLYRGFTLNRSAGAKRIQEHIDYVVFHHMMQNHHKFNTTDLLALDWPELQKKRLYIAVMDSFKNKRDIIENMDPTQFDINLDLESVRGLLVHFLQSRNAVFSRQILTKLMSDIIKHHDQNVNHELFCAAVTGGETQLAQSLAQRKRDRNVKFLTKY